MEDSIKEYVKNKVIQFLNDHEIETNKFEVKRDWYKLNWKSIQENGLTKYNKDYFEFLKDVTSIINSNGGDSGFIVIGIDAANKKLIDARIEDSGLNDSSQIKDIIVSNIDTPFTIDIGYVNVEGKNLSIIHIPTSLHKPHIILRYFSSKNQEFQNEIFVRNGSGTSIAKKADLDRMYWERGNIVLPEKLSLTINTPVSGFEARTMSGFEDNSRLDYSLYLGFSNQGMRPATIYAIEFDLVLENPEHEIKKSIGEVIRFKSNLVASIGGNKDCITIQPNGYEQLRTLFLSPTLHIHAGRLLAYINKYNNNGINPDIQNIYITDNKGHRSIPEVAFIK
ncbi:MAG: ATP-binding protein [Bacteroidetes bacterium]|nr:ATP-binding protein [Bacteroidota bacterium]